VRAIHRDDGELCGFVRVDGATWHAMSIFGGILEVTDSEASAERIVRDIGLPALAERWLLTTDSSSDEELVCLQEVSPAGVTVSLGYYSLPGVPTQRIARDQIDRGEVHLRRALDPATGRWS
jgi:hypothetical protein